MISLKQLANLFENGLNNALNNKELEFKIWATAGEYQKPVREDNTVPNTILGNLRTSSSANDANDLVMGVNSLTLDFAIPIYPPRTNANQTNEELDKIRDGQYPFVEYIANAINGYFQYARVCELEDADNKSYSVAFQAGTNISGVASLMPKLGNVVPVSIYIQVYFIQGGTNSKDIKIYIDTNLMPFQAVRLGRSAVVERDIYMGETISKCVASSTAFSVDADFPSSDNTATLTALNFLLDGEPNTAHFVKVDWGKISKLYLMTYNTAQSSATGITIAGLSVSLIELNTQCDYRLPEGFKCVRFTFADTATRELGFTLDRQADTYIAGVGAVHRQGENTVQLADSSFEYDEESGMYFVDMIVSEPISIEGATTSYSIL